MVCARRGAAVIVALGLGTATLAAATVSADAATYRLPVGTQRMQMPLDCEATSLTIALASVGVHTTQQYVQGHFPSDTRAPVLGADGLPAQWGDPYKDFVGHVMGSEPGSNPHWATYPGWGAYAPTVAGVARSLGVPIAAQLTGWNPQALYAAVEAGHPVLVWTTVNHSTQTARTWTAWDGRIVPWTEAGHVVVLMGVNTSAGTLEFSDPLTGGYNSTTMSQFARTFTIYGDMAIVIERTARAQVRTATVHHVVPTPRATATPTPRPTPPTQVLQHMLVSSRTDLAMSAASPVVAIGVLSDTPAPYHAGAAAVWLLAVVVAALTLATVAALVAFQRRRRRCAG